MHLTSKTILTIAIAAVLTAPATATWYAHGNFEPNTPYDDGTWMWQTPPNATEERVYFHVVTATQYSTVNGKPSVNPNVGLLHTQIEPAGSERHTAHLGVWQDCNGDGYIGMAEGALREYSAALLASTAVCPPVTGAPNAWPAGAYNYNGWVSEFIPITSGAAAGIADKRTYRDDDVAVWGDFHRPDEQPFHRSCALRPLPRGTLESTGGLINYFDCRVDLLGPWNQAMTAVGDPLGLSFSDEDNARTGTLGQIQLGGPESDAHSPVTVWDCSDQTRIGDEANKTAAGPLVPNVVANSRIAGVKPAPGNTANPSLAGLVNHTAEGAMVSGGEARDCDTSNDFGHDFYEPVEGIAFETDFNGVNPKNKTEADWNFGVSTLTRGNIVLNFAPGGMGGTAGMPGDGGVGPSGTAWLSNSIWVSKTGPRTLRVDLDNGGVKIAPAYWLSFYAKVGQATTDRNVELPGGDGTYGSWHCGNDFETPGIRNGWNCDPDLWYINPDGSFPDDKADLAHPGWSYDLRDVDCYDGRIGSTGVSVQPAFYGDEPCDA